MGFPKHEKRGFTTGRSEFGCGQGQLSIGYKSSSESPPSSPLPSARGGRCTLWFLLFLLPGTLFESRVNGMTFFSSGETTLALYLVGSGAQRKTKKGRRHVWRRISAGGNIRKNIALLAFTGACRLPTAEPWGFSALFRRVRRSAASTNDCNNVNLL